MHVERMCREYVDDIVEAVKTPTPPPPDYSIQENRIIAFEEKNFRKKLYYTDFVYRMFLELQDRVLEALGLEIQQYDWEFSVDNLQDWINDIKDSEVREQFQRRFDNLVFLCRMKPANKKPIYTKIREVIENFAFSLPDESQNLLEDLGIDKKKFKNGKFFLVLFFFIYFSYIIF